MNRALVEASSAGVTRQRSSEMDKQMKAYNIHD
jgi:hypothetical protein